MKCRIDNKGRTIDEYGRVFEPVEVAGMKPSKRTLRRKPYIELARQEGGEHEVTKDAVS